MRNVTLKQLRVLAAVVRTGSVTGAAQQLNVSPPAVTLQMQLLQDHAGLPLVERNAAGTTATDAGAEILRAVDQIETILADCSAALAAISGTKTGMVSVGVISTAKYFAPRVLGAFLSRRAGGICRIFRARQNRGSSGSYLKKRTKKLFSVCLRTVFTPVT